MAGKSPFFPDIKVGSRFFVFKELAGSRLAGASKTLNDAKNVLATTINSFSASMSSAKSSQDDGETVGSALDFLRIAYQTELDSEKLFYEDRLLNNPNIPAEYQSEIKSLIGEKDFDYYRFMSILKEIELGKDKWEKELNGMIGQIGNFQGALQTYYEMYDEEQYNPRNGEKDERDIKTLIGNLFNDPDITFRQEFTPMQKALHQTHAFSSAVLNSNRSANSKALSKLLNQYMGVLIGGGHVSLQGTAQNEAFTAQAGLIFLEELYDMRGSTKSSVVSINNAKKLLDMLKESEETNTPLTNVHAKNIRRKCDILLKQLDLLQDYGEAMRPKSKNLVRYNADTEQIVNITKSIRTRVADIFNDPELKARAEKRFNGKEGKSNKAAFLSRLQEVLAENQGKSKFQDLIASNLNDLGIVESINNIIASNSKIDMYLQTEYGSASAEQFLFNTFVKNVGKYGGKADNFNIMLGQAIATFEIPDDVLKQVLPQVMNTYERAYQLAYQQEMERIQKKLTLNEILPPTVKNPLKMSPAEKAAAASKLFRTEDNYSSQADARATTQALDQAKIKLEQLLKKNLKNIPESQQKFNLDELFTIETSVKFSDYIFDNLGFKAGTLGNSLFEQLENLNFIAEECGFTGINLQNLTFAILNAGDGMIGTNYRPKLEESLAIFASLLMFRTGSNLAKQVRQKMSNVQVTIRPNASMRLYTLGTVYVPASFILKTTYDALTKAKSYLDTEERMIGMQLQIINPVTVNDIPPKPAVYTQRGQMWYETAAQNYGRVSLSGRIMAGFLDVLEGIQGAMNGTGR